MRFGRRRRSSGAWVLGGMGVLVAGTAAAALADPRRRAGAASRAQRAVKDAEHLVEAGVRDLGHRAQGLAHEARARLTPEHAADEVLAERVRARLGHLSSHARALHVTVSEGQVELSGPVLRAERTQVLRAARAVRGVRGLADRLEPHDRADVAALQGGGPARAAPSVLPPGSPGYRLVAGAAGAFLVARALLGRGLMRIPAGLFGATLLGKVMGDAREARHATAGPAGERHREVHEVKSPAELEGRRGERPAPEVHQVKSPAELEPGVASARPEPLRPGRVDRPDLRRAPAPRRGETGPAEEEEEREPEDRHAPHDEFTAPPAGAPVRERDLGAILPPEDLGEEREGEERRAPPDEGRRGPSGDRG